MKKFFVSIFAVLLSMSAFAADSMKGTNQNGYAASVGYDFIASAKHAGGVTNYRTTFSNDVYTLSDANGSQFSNWQTWTGNSTKASSVNGWTYNLRKAEVSCQYSASVVYTPGRTGTESISDSCALASGN